MGIQKEEWFKAISYTAVGFASRKRPFSTEAQIGLSYTVEKGLSRLNFFRLSFPTGGSGRKTRLFRLDLSVEKLSRKSFTPVFCTHRIAHPTTKHNHTPTHISRYHTAVSYNSADAALAITAVASRRKSAWRTPSSARQQRVSHDSSSAATPAVALAALG